MKEFSTGRVPKPEITYGAILGGVISQLRERRGHRQHFLAKTLNITQPAYSRIESGESTMNVSQLRVIAECLATTPALLTAEADKLVTQLRAQGVEVKDDKKIHPAAILIGLAILAALIR